MEEAEIKPEAEIAPARASRTGVRAQKAEQEAEPDKRVPDAPVTIYSPSCS